MAPQPPTPNRSRLSRIARTTAPTSTTRDRPFLGLRIVQPRLRGLQHSAEMEAIASAGVDVARVHTMAGWLGGCNGEERHAEAETLAPSTSARKPIANGKRATKSAYKNSLPLNTNEKARSLPAMKSKWQFRRSASTNVLGESDLIERTSSETSCAGFP